MKTIQVTDEMHEFLISLSIELNTQDHRGTAMPYFFQIQETTEIPTAEGIGEEVWVQDGTISLRTDKDIKEAVFEYNEWDLGNKKHDDFFSELSIFEIESILRENYWKINVDTGHLYKNAFLTEKACNKHIQANSYHYENPNSYLTHAFRNPELEKVLQFICELTGGELHK